MDKTLVVVAIISFLGTFVTAALGLVGLAIVNRSEKRKTAEVTVENVLERHLDFKDDVLEFKDQQIRDRDATIATRDATIAAQELVIRELRDQLLPEKRDLSDG